MIPAIVIAGPTAAGKTGLAIEMVQKHPELAIVSVDSAQVYRRMNIGTAKPSAEELTAAPHALIDIVEPWEEYSVGHYLRDCEAVCREITAAGQTPLLVGGTMMYFNALLNGLNQMPDVPAEVREAIANEAAERGWEAMHAELGKIDHEAASTIRPSDPQRIGRALEIHRATGKSLSHWQKAKPVPLIEPIKKIVVNPEPRKILHERIAERRDFMFQRGFVEEVKGLLGEPEIDGETGALRAVGYRQVIDHLEGRTDFEECRARVLFATRQLAKRQLTWLRKW